MKEDIIIDWKKYVDQIYCVTVADHNNENLRRELKRVDILDSGIYYETEAIKSFIFDILFNNFINHTPYASRNYTFDNLISNYYYMKHAQSHNYKRILIIEDDVVFLKNKEYIIDILDAYNKINESNKIFTGNLMHFDKFNFDEGLTYRNIYYYYDKRFSLNINKVSNDISILGGAAFNIYDKDAYNNIINLIDNHNYFMIDTYRYLLKNISNLNIYYNDTNICIQHNDMYKSINWFYLYNLDIYEDYLLNINIDRIVNDFKNKIYPNIFENYVYLDGVKQYVYDYFNQINFLIFDNKLEINDLIK